MGKWENIVTGGNRRLVIQTALVAIFCADIEADVLNVTRLWGTGDHLRPKARILSIWIHPAFAQHREGNQEQNRHENKERAGVTQFLGDRSSA